MLTIGVQQDALRSARAHKAHITFQHIVLCLGTLLLAAETVHENPGSSVRRYSTILGGTPVVPGADGLVQSKGPNARGFPRARCQVTACRQCLGGVWPRFTLRPAGGRLAGEPSSTREIQVGFAGAEYQLGIRGLGPDPPGTCGGAGLRRHTNRGDLDNGAVQPPQQHTTWAACIIGPPGIAVFSPPRRSHPKGEASPARTAFHRRRRPAPAVGSPSDGIMQEEPGHP